MKEMNVIENGTVRLCVLLIVCHLVEKRGGIFAGSFGVCIGKVYTGMIEWMDGKLLVLIVILYDKRSKVWTHVCSIWG